MEHKIYNPASQPKEWLIQHFVVRTNVFEKIFKDIQTNPMKYPAQHYLIQGQRGMGKTTLLLRLKYEIENTPKLSKWLLPVFFNEEAYDLTSLSNLWEKLLKYFDELWNTGGEYYKKTNEFVGNKDYEKKCFELLISILKDKGKKLIIFFDNFGQLFLDNLKEKEQHRFREILMHCEDIRIVGASAIVLRDLHDYSKPFFEFFKIINLEGLNKTETLQLITKLQENSDYKIDLKKSKAKIETLAILTSGVIRTIMLIYEVVLNDQDGSALHDLEIILDRITPLYKHRIEDLPVQQRKIMDVIAKSWDAISTKEIAENIRENGQPMATKLISAQLQQLEKNNVIEKKQTNTKNHLYQVKERFFNIWYLMRNGDRMDKCRVIWLTKFLESWYNNENEFDNFIQDHIKHLRSGGYNPDSAVTIAEALSYSNKLSISSLDKLLKETSAILNEKQQHSLSTISKQRTKYINDLILDGKYTDSIKILSSIENRSDLENALLAVSYGFLEEKVSAKKILISTKSDDSQVNFLLATTYFLLSDFKEAINLLCKYDGPDKSSVNYLLGACYEQLKDIIKAKGYYIESINLNKYVACTNLIKIFIEEDNVTEAEKYSKIAAKNGYIDSTKLFIAKYDFKFWESQSSTVEDLIEIGIKTNKLDPDYYSFKARILAFKAKYDLAYKYALKADDLYSSKTTSAFYYVNLFLLLYILIDCTADKRKTAILFKKLNQNYPLTIEIYRAFAAIWNSDYETGTKILQDNIVNHINDSTTIKSDYPKINNIFLLLIAKKQYNSLLRIFNNNDYLKDQFKPTYYALIHFLQNEHSNEYLRMGSELKQPVEDILKEVEEMSIKYA